MPIETDRFSRKGSARRSRVCKRVVSRRPGVLCGGDRPLLQALVVNAVRTPSCEYNHPALGLPRRLTSEGIIVRRAPGEMKACSRGRAVIQTIGIQTRCGCSWDERKQRRNGFAAGVIAAEHLWALQVFSPMMVSSRRRVPNRLPPVSVTTTVSPQVTS